MVVWLIVSIHVTIIGNDFINVAIISLTSVFVSVVRAKEVVAVVVGNVRAVALFILTDNSVLSLDRLEVRLSVVDPVAFSEANGLVEAIVAADWVAHVELEPLVSFVYDVFFLHVTDASQVMIRGVSSRFFHFRVDCFIIYPTAPSICTKTDFRFFDKIKGSVVDLVSFVLFRDVNSDC